MPSAGILFEDRLLELLKSDLSFLLMMIYSDFKKLDVLEAEHRDVFKCFMSINFDIRPAAPWRNEAISFNKLKSATKLLPIKLLGETKGKLYFVLPK